MKYLRYGCLSIAKNILFTFFMVLEILVLLVSTNVMIASVNSREMLKKPFSNFLSQKGYYYFTEPMWDTAEQYKEFTGLFAKLRSAKFYTAESNVNEADIVDDEIFFNYSMPLQSGSWPTQSKDEQGRIYAVVSPDLKKAPGDTIELYGDRTVVVSGVLTNITYVPLFSNTAGSAKEFYRSLNYSSKTDEDGNYMGGDNSSIIVSSSGFYEGSDDDGFSCSGFIVYDENISDEDIKYNEKIIEQIKNYNIETAVVSPEFTELSAVNEGTDAYIADIYNRMIPVILGVAAVVIIGLIGTIAINTVTQLKNYGIYYLCGSRWSDCLKISFANISIILLFSGGLSALLLYMLQSFNLDYLIGQTYGWNNLIISLAMLVGMIALSLIIPFGIIRFTSPVEVVKSEK